MKGIIFGFCLIMLLTLAPGVWAQQQQGLRALARALRSHDFDRGRDSSMDRIPIQTMVARVNRNTIQELELPPALQAAFSLLDSGSDCDKYIRPLMRPSTRAQMTIRSREPHKFYGVSATVQAIRLILRRSYLLPSA